jgi:hypothetical protein
MPDKPDGARRLRWKRPMLVALVINLLVIVALGVVAQLRYRGTGPSLWLTAASGPAVEERGSTSAQPGGNTPRGQRTAALAPRFDEFAIRAAIKRVPAPPGTGLPGIESIIIEPENVVLLSVNLRVPGVDNAAWSLLPVEERREYAEQVLAALVAAYPEVETYDPWPTVYFSVNIWERFLITAPLGPADPDAAFICVPANDGLHQECSGSGTGVLLAVPTRQDQH